MPLHAAPCAIRYKPAMTHSIAKIACWGLAIAAGLYIAVCVLMLWQQRKLMYWPQATTVDPARTNFSLVQGDITLRGWQDHPHPTGGPARDAVIYWGGNAERVEAVVPQLRAWLPAPSIYTLAYRGFGASDGAPTEAALEADALALWDWVRQQHPAGRITIIGRSLGTGVAAAVAAQRQPARAVLVTPFDNMTATVRDHYGWLPVGLLLHDTYPSDERMAQFQGPVLVVRAGQDTLVRPARTDALERTLAARPMQPGATLQVFNAPQADHLNILQAAGLGAVLQQFVDGSAP